MKLVISAICCSVLCCLPAFAQKPAAGAMTDQQFVDFAAQTDMLEAHLGQMAQNQADAQAVKDYAQMLVTDHTSDFQKLGLLAAKMNLNFPNGLDAEHNKMIAPLEKPHGAAFDHLYVHTMVEGHTKAIAIYKKEAVDAQNADLKEYAAETLPTLQKHLDGAKDLLKQGGK
jgi:putative membrane protein